MFRNFAEFVALHYALSNRNETKYWQDINNKDWLKYGFKQAINRRNFDFSLYDNFNGGLHAIATGMHWSPTELNNVLWVNEGFTKKDYEKIWSPYIEKLDNRKKQWSEKYKNSKTLYRYLKEEIYHNE